MARGALPFHSHRINLLRRWAPVDGLWAAVSAVASAAVAALSDGDCGGGGGASAGVQPALAALIPLAFLGGVRLVQVLNFCLQF